MLSWINIFQSALQRHVLISDIVWLQTLSFFLFSKVTKSFMTYIFPITAFPLLKRKDSSGQENTFAWYDAHLSYFFVVDDLVLFKNIGASMLTFHFYYMSFHVAIWVGARQNQQNDQNGKQRLRSVWTFVQSDHSSMSAWSRSASECATHKAHSEDWSDWADDEANLSLRWIHRSLCWFCHVSGNMHLFALASHKTPTVKPFDIINCIWSTEMSNKIRQILRGQFWLFPQSRLLRKIELYVMDLVWNI